MKKNFIKVRTVKDIAIFSSLIILGCVLVAVPSAATAVYVGYTSIALGVFLCFLLKSGYKDVDTKERYLKKEFPFLGIMKNSILSALLSSPDSIQLSEVGKGQVLVLKMYYSKSAGKAILQLFEYVPHQYEPCSEMYEYEISMVDKLLKSA